MTRPARFGHLSSMSASSYSREKPTRLPSKSLRPTKETWASPGSIGTLLLRTRTWVCGKTSISPRAGEIALRAPFVTSKLDSDYKTAALTISADLRNASATTVHGELRAEIEGIHVVQSVELGPNETKTVTLTPEEYPQLKLEHPRLWWPYQMGQPELYSAKLTVETEGRVSDSAEVRFGVREVTSELTDKGYRLFKVNGRKLLVRGAAWAPDMFLRWSPAQATAALEYVRDMHLNAIRMEGRMERDEFFDMADRMGVLIMPGWTCCDAWEKWDQWTAEQTTIAGASLVGPDYPPAQSSQCFRVALRQ